MKKIDLDVLIWKQKVITMIQLQKQGKVTKKQSDWFWNNIWRIHPHQRLNIEYDKGFEEEVLRT